MTVCLVLDIHPKFTLLSCLFHPGNLWKRFLISSRSRPSFRPNTIIFPSSESDIPYWNFSSLSWGVIARFVRLFVPTFFGVFFHRLPRDVWSCSVLFAKNLLRKLDNLVRVFGMFSSFYSLRKILCLLSGKVLRFEVVNLFAVKCVVLWMTNCF